MIAADRLTALAAELSAQLVIARGADRARITHAIARAAREELEQDTSAEGAAVRTLLAAIESGTREIGE